MTLTNDFLSRIGEIFPLGEPLETKQLRVSGMKFDIAAYEAKGLGHVSVMTAAGFFGLMKMDTLIITPTAVDMPLFSYDRVLAMGNDTLIFELYDTLLGQPDLSPLEQAKAKAAHLPNHDLGAHWYDAIKLPVSLSRKGKKVHTVAFDVAAADYLTAYLEAAQAAPGCDATPKREKAAIYVDGLLTHGGPSTDVFKKGIGEEKTAELFRKTLFATEV